jgi:hypothetical protein
MFSRLRQQFGGSAPELTAAAVRRLGRDEPVVQEEQLVEVTRLAVEAGFAEDAVKERLRARLDFPG